MGVRVHHAIPYNARAKIIEANFGRLGKFDASLPEWCGHKTEARPERFDALVRDHEQWVKGTRTETPFRSVDQIARLYGDAIRDLNERPLEGDGMRKATPTGMGWWCPNEAWDILARGVARRPVPADVLHLCFAKRRELTVKHGEVQVTFDARPYHYRIDGEPAQLMALNGQTVELAYDPLDLAEAAIYWQGRFVGLARCVALRKMGEDQFVDDERLRRAARREVKKAIAVVHAQVPLAGAVERLGRRRAIAPAREEVCQAVTAVEIPAAVLEAAEAVRASRELPAVIEVERAEVASGDEAEDFEFFKS